jgi:hypothetical protein
MGVLEEKNRKRKKREDLQRIILKTVAAAGVLSIAVLAPNVLGAMAKIKMRPTKHATHSIYRSRNRLIEKGWLKRDKRGLLLITSQGERALLTMQAFSEGLPKPKKWDGKWRMLMFDIPHRRGSLRDKVRNSLRAVGFVLFQRSVWIYPYDCEDFIALLKADFKIGKDMRYIIADSIEGDRMFRKHFSLAHT